MYKKYGCTILIFLLFFYLLGCPGEAFLAVERGLALWYRSVLPVLFPFMILSGIMVRLRIAEQLPAWLPGPICRLFGCSREGIFAVITGFLCGFPMGAKITHDLEARGQISAQEAAYLYGFVNNVSPAFLLSFLARGQLNRPECGSFFLFCVLGSSLLYGLATRPAERFPDQPADTARRAFAVSFADIDESIQDAVTNTVRLGAYITVFSLLQTAAGAVFPSDGICGKLLAGGLEVTTGIASVLSWKLPWRAAAPALCAVCAFGGCSAFAQTVSIASMNRKTALAYLKSRVIITLLAVFLASGILLLLRLRSSAF